MTNIEAARAAIKASPAIRTLADLDVFLRNESSLSTRARHDRLAALTTLARAAAKPLAVLPAQPDALRRILNTLSAVMAGVSKGRWRNVRSLLRQSLDLAHTTLGVGVFRNPRSPAWETCFAHLLKNGPARNGLSRLSGFCSREGIEPWQVNDEVMRRFLDALQADALLTKPVTIHSRAIRAWNTQVSTHPDWPAARLSSPNRRNTYAVPMDAFPLSLQDDVRAWLKRLAGTDLCDGADFFPLRPNSIRTHTGRIKNLLSATVQAGVDPTSLYSLADIVRPENVAKALSFIQARHNGVWSQHTAGLAALICSIARHYVGVGPNQLKQLAGIRKKVSPQRYGMTERNRALLRQLDDPQTMYNLLCLPMKLWHEVRRGGPPSAKLARLLRGAVALEVLIMAPIRMFNLTSLQTGTNLVGGCRGTLTLALAAKQVKNSQPLETNLPVPTARLVNLYLEQYQPLLTQTPCTWLFPNPAGDGPMSAQNLRLQIEALARDRVGVTLHPHLFRHIAAKRILDSDPGAFGRAQLILGHKSVQTTKEFYSDNDNRVALGLYGANVLHLRGDETGPEGKGSGPRRRKNRR